MLKEETLKKIVKEIIEETGAEKIILFGSYAKSLQTDNSDIDILIIEKEPFGKNRSRRREIN
ncbi:MAG: nucleotidyltransferase domain-containing protein, partial [Ignavibacteriota bacterium]